jgi:hypothetical protein
MIAKKSAPACWPESRSELATVPKIYKVAGPANYRLKLPARGTSVADGWLRMRAAA